MVYIRLDGLPNHFSSSIQIPKLFCISHQKLQEPLHISSKKFISSTFSRPRSSITHTYTQTRKHNPSIYKHNWLLTHTLTSLINSHIWGQPHRVSPINHQDGLLLFQERERGRWHSAPTAGPPAAQQCQQGHQTWQGQGRRHVPAPSARSSPWRAFQQLQRPASQPRRQGLRLQVGPKHEREQLWSSPSKTDPPCGIRLLLVREIIGLYKSHVNTWLGSSSPSSKLQYGSSSLRTHTLAHTQLDNKSAWSHRRLWCYKGST